MTWRKVTEGIFKPSGLWADLDYVIARRSTCFALTINGRDVAYCSSFRHAKLEAQRQANKQTKGKP